MTASQGNGNKIRLPSSCVIAPFWSKSQRSFTQILLERIATPFISTLRLKSVTGYTPEEWMADDLLWFKLIHEDDKARVWAENLRTVEIGEPFMVDYRLCTRDGQIKWVHDESWLIRDASGKPLFWQGYIVDITERKQSELELEHRAAELSALQETVLNLTARHTLPDLLNLIVERATMLLNASHGMLYLANPEEQTVTCVVSYNTQKDYTGTTLKIGRGSCWKGI